MTDKIEKPAEVVKAPEGFIFAEDGDTYETIAERLGKGYTAVSVWKANNENPLYPNALVKVK